METERIVVENDLYKKHVCLKRQNIVKYENLLYDHSLANTYHQYELKSFNKVDKDNEKKQKIELYTLYPHGVKFSELAKTLKSINVDGLEHITGVLGDIRNIDESNNSEKNSNDTDTNISDNKNVRLPLAGSLAFVYYHLYFEHKKYPFEVSDKPEKPHEFSLTEDFTLPGILVACRFLSPGQTGIFLLPPSTMYGELGTPNGIPPSATFLLILHLVNWIDNGAVQRYDLLEDETKKQFEMIHSFLNSINDVAKCHFKNNKYEESLNFYEKNIEILNKCVLTKQNSDDINSWKFKTYLNMSNCYLKLEKSGSALNILNEASVLINCKENSKYLYNRGKCLMMMEDYDNAFSLLVDALHLNPNSLEIGIELAKLDAIITANKDKDKLISKKMISTNKEDSSSNKKYNSIKINVLNIYNSMVEEDLKEYPLPDNLPGKSIKIIEEIVNDMENFKIVSSITDSGCIERNFVIE